MNSLGIDHWGSFLVGRVKSFDKRCRLVLGPKIMTERLYLIGEGHQDLVDSLAVMLKAFRPEGPDRKAEVVVGRLAQPRLPGEFLPLPPLES